MPQKNQTAAFKAKGKPTPCSHRGLGFAILIAGLAFITTGGPAAETSTPLAKARTVTVNGKSYLLESRLKSILVGSFTYNFDHKIGVPNLEATLKRIGAAEGWTVDVTSPSNKGSEVTAAKLAGYQVFFGNFISDWASSGQFPTAARQAIQDFVEVKGNGVFVMHSSGDSPQSTNWPWFYSTLHPCIYTGESSRSDVSAPVAVPAAIKSHPVMDGISFNDKDTVMFSQGEFHTFQKLITEVQPSAELFLRMNGAKCTKGGSGSNCGISYTNYSTPGGYPVSWAFPAKKGTVGYFMEGHDLNTMQSMGQAVWDKFFKQFMYYMAGYDSTVVPTSGIHKEGSIPEAVDKSGITFHSGQDAGVLITRGGNHLVALYDMAGRQMYQDHGTQVPMNYDLNDKLHGVRPGIYVLRVAVPGAVQSKRILIR